MSTLQTKPRLRAALVFLAERGRPTPRSDVLNHVAEAFPPTAEEDEPVKTPGRPSRWITAFLFESSKVTKAGWIHKDGRTANWAITEEGRKALQDFPDAESLHAEGVRRYNSWYNAQTIPRRHRETSQSSSVPHEGVVPDGLGGEPTRSDDGEVAGYWWVNQGRSYANERDGGYVWAPQKTLGGTAITTHTDMSRLRPGDVMVHYAQGAIRAIGRVSERAIEVPSPAPAPGDEPRDGFLSTVAYFELAEPLPLTALPENARVSEGGPFNSSGGMKQGYLYPISVHFADLLRRQFAASWPPGSPLADYTEAADVKSFVEPTFAEIASAVAKAGLRIDIQTLRRYHVSLRAGGFVILSGLSGTGKTWLAEAYADASGAERLVVPVAPNWTTNEDLLGYYNPFDNAYHHTPFSRFLRDAAKAYAAAQAQNAIAPPFHLILDEMNLARVEYYFAKFLSAMETRARQKTAAIELTPDEAVLLTPNLYFIGTVNVDETTHGFADKIYDRAQLVELPVSRDLISQHIGEVAWAATLLSVWDGLIGVAPFAFRVIDQVHAYITDAETLDVPWEVALDEQLLQKVLPKVRGVDLRTGEALQRVIDACGDNHPLTAAKAAQMLQAFKQQGFASYF